MAARSRRLSALGAALFGLGACVQDDGSRFNPIADVTTVSEDEERELGLEFDRELRKHLRVIEDPVVAGFINALGQELVQTIEPQPFVYRFRIIDAPTLNAFAVPGGYVYFHSGTVLSAGSIDELAGVMGHEIAHVKAHHYARMRAKTQIPDLLVGLAGLAAAIATEEPGVLIAAQAANVAVKLRFSREFENEADRFGSVFMTRAGYDPAGITRFFERIVDEQEEHPDQIPPYLFSHPEVEERIASVERQARDLRPTRSPDPAFAEALPEVQGRLAYLVDTGRDSVPPLAPPEDPHRIDAELAEAERLTAAGQADEALVVLTRAEAREPRDPRASFRIGELLSSRGRHAQAIAAYLRTIRLDPTRAQVFYQLGLAHKASGNRHSAVHAFEQASRRAGDSSNLHRRAEWQIEILVFPVLLDGGFADGVATGGDTPLGNAREQFAPGVQRVAWWARMHPRYAAYRKGITVRWIDPHGQVVAETPIEVVDRSHVGAILELPEPGATTEGRWNADIRYKGELIDRRSFRVAQSSR